MLALQMMLVNLTCVVLLVKVEPRLATLLHNITKGNATLQLLCRIFEVFILGFIYDCVKLLFCEFTWLSVLFWKCMPRVRIWLGFSLLSPPTSWWPLTVCLCICAPPPLPLLAVCCASLLCLSDLDCFQNHIIIKQFSTLLLYLYI